MYIYNIKYIYYNIYIMGRATLGYHEEKNVLAV